MPRPTRYCQAIPLIVCAAALAFSTREAKAGVNISASSNAVVDQTTIISGTPPTVAFEDRVYRGASGESRTQYEFPLPTLPAGSIINSVTFNTYISGWQSGGGIDPNVTFYGYAGNGTYQAADANQLSTSIGSTGNITGSTPDNFNLSTSLVNNNNSHLGLNLYAQNLDRYAAFAKTGTYPNIPNLTVNANIPFTGTLSAKPTFDQKAESPTSSSFTLTEGESVINTQYYPQASVDRRGIIEFDLAAIPTTAVLSNATLQFYVNTITTDGTNYPQPLIYGYAGNALGDSSDAAQTGTLLATAAPITSTGPLITINLSASQIQNLRAQSPYLGIMVRGSANGDQFGFVAREGTAFGPAPTLNFAYSIPEPTMLALIPASLLLFRRRR
jgi:hypothetical protein